MNYNEALTFIHSVNNYFCKPGLDRIKALCEFLGNPQDELKFIHVAGTNGKGSFCSMLTSILKSAGYKVGTYTSPYILNFNERIAINGEPIPDDELASLCDNIKPFCENATDKPTEFEVITAIGFEYFKKQNCDVVVLECGLGGRFDATNIIKTPVLSVITGVDFDHQNFLGNTIEEIANEKAGIIKKGVPCLWCGDNSAAYKLISETANEVGSPLFVCRHHDITFNNMDLDGTDFNFGNYKNVLCPLLSVYQPLNTANAITAAEILIDNGFNITKTHIYDGIKNARWPARFEILSHSPTVIFDGAHNPQGVTAAVESIKTYFKDQTVNILTGVMSDKDYNYIASKIGCIAKKVFCIRPDNPRALAADKYADIFSKMDVPALAFNSINDGIDAALKDSNENNIPLIILGSLYMYGDVYKRINAKKQ